MKQFAVDDKVDATLHDIKVQMQTTDHYEYIAGSAFSNSTACNWSGWNDNATIENKKELHLNYSGTANEFGSIYQSTTDDFRILDAEDKGWSQLYIRQCKDAKHSRLTSPKQDLGEQNLCNLFSTIMMIHVVNEPEVGLPDPSIVDITVKKEWKLDNGGTKSDSVTVELLKNGIVDKTVTLNENNNWSHTWSGLSPDYNWTVRESNVPNGFTSTVKHTGNIFVIINDDNPMPPVNMTVIKKWVDYGNSRPNFVEVTLYNGDTAVESVRLGDWNNWSYSWYNLNGHGSWKVTETNIPKDYVPSYSYKNGVVTITNTAALIHTGQLNWPIIVMGILGIAFIICGFIVVLKKRKNEHD